MTITSEELAHIVFPGQKLRDVMSGTKTKAKAMCGAWVVKKLPRNAPVCRVCFDLYHGQGDPPDAKAS